MTWRQQRRRYLTPRVLVIDEVGYVRLTASQAQQLFDLVTARYEHGRDHPHQQPQLRRMGPALLGDEVLATALLDRLLHHADVLAIDGRSYRMKERHLPESIAPTPLLPPRWRLADAFPQRARAERRNFFTRSRWVNFHRHPQRLRVAPTKN